MKPQGKTSNSAPYKLGRGTGGDFPYLFKFMCQVPLLSSSSQAKMSATLGKILLQHILVWLSVYDSACLTVKANAWNSRCNFLEAAVKSVYKAKQNKFCQELNYSPVLAMYRSFFICGEAVEIPWRKVRGKCLLDDELKEGRNVLLPVSVLPLLLTHVHI